MPSRREKSKKGQREKGRKMKDKRKIGMYRKWN
jgi:hypothetical protein